MMYQQKISSNAQLKNEFRQFLNTSRNDRNRTYKKYQKWLEANSFDKDCDRPYVIKDPSIEVAAIGDIHGDYCSFLNCLKLIGIIGTNITNKTPISQILWNTRTSNVVVVQTGDIMDAVRSGPFSDVSCLSVIKVLDLVDHLNNYAERFGYKGRIYTLIGNHELMNLTGNHRYAHAKEMHDLGAKNSRDYSRFVEAGKSEFAKKLACRTTGVLLIINDSVFVHGGVSPYFVDMLTKKMNQVIPLKFIALIVNEIIRKFAMYGLESLSNDEKAIFNIITDGSNGLVWYRKIGKSKNSQNVCKILNSVLMNDSDLNNIVIGHTVQAPFIGSQSCKNNRGGFNRIFRIDVGMSDAFQMKQYGRTHEQVLILGPQAGSIKLRYFDRNDRVMEKYYSDSTGFA